MPSLLTPVIAFYDYALQPLPAFAWLGVPVSTLDVVAALRLAVSLRQVRQLYHERHLSGISVTNGRPEYIELRSRVRDFVATLVMVHGGEAIAAPWLGLQPSFLLSGTTPMIFLSAHALVDLLPTVPRLSINTELPLTILHAFHRTILLCNVIPRAVAGHASPAIATSPYSLLLTAFIMPNGGPFFTNLFSLLHPTQMQVSTPPELLPYGWTATDLWAAPLVTGLYATLTHAQPFFAYLHALLFSFLSPLGLAYLSDASAKIPKHNVVIPLEANTARAACAVVLCALYVNRAVRTYGRPSRAAIAARKPEPVPSASVGEKLVEEETTSPRRRASTKEGLKEKRTSGSPRSNLRRRVPA